MKRVLLKTPGHSHQRGMSLIIGLILLAVLMALTTIGFRNTTLSERMTGNAFDRNTSFQSAENAGKEALQVIVAGSFNVATTGHYNPPLDGGNNTEFWTKGAGVNVTTPSTGCPVTAPFSWISCAAAVGNKYANNAVRAQYAIELLSQSTTGITTSSTYRVTSRSTGGSGDAEVVLQSIYVHKTVVGP